MALGIAIALLIIHKGTAFMSNVLKGTSDINEKKKAIKNDSRSIGIKEPNMDFLMSPVFDGCNFNSKDPSSTIKIKPIVPKIGSTGCKFGIGVCINSSICPTPNPRIRSIITEGILVFFALKSNM